MSRPKFNTDGLDRLPAMIVARMMAKAAASWCYVTPDGCSFYLDERRATRMKEVHGGAVYPPEVAV